MKLNVENLSFSYEAEKILEDISLHISKGEFIGLIGANGSGKSTMLKHVYRALKPDSGTVFLDGVDVNKMGTKEVARVMGVIGQENDVPFDFSIEEIVAMGRSPYKKLFEGDTAEDREIITSSLKKIGLEQMAERSYGNLSGGEKQRVLLARVLAQQTDLLILDEPTNHLDVHHQLRIFDLIKRLDVTVLAAIHDLNLAALYCDIIYVIKNGQIYKTGTPKEVLTKDVLWDVFQVQADVVIHPRTKKVSITYIPEDLQEEKEEA